MTIEAITFAALGRCVDQARGTAHDHPIEAVPLDGYRELWAARRFVEVARRVLADARWESGQHEDQATVPKHHLVLLEAALNLATGQRAATADGFPHAGSAVKRGVCDAGYCPCRDVRRPSQPSLLDRAAS